MTTDSQDMDGLVTLPPGAGSEAATSPVIVVDLDRTLVRTDLLHELAVRVLSRKPWLVFQMVFWRLQGRASFKRHLAKHNCLVPAALPYNNELLDWLRRQRAAGRRLVLVTDGDETLAKSVAAHLGLFDAVIIAAESGDHNPTARLEAIRRAAGGHAFDFAGNSSADWPIWSEAKTPIVVNPSARLARRAATRWPEAQVFPSTTGKVRTWLRLLRVHQWAKNLIVLVPVLTAHQLSRPPVLIAALACMTVLSLTASALYLINDICDLENDRNHARKRHRPLASGCISLRQGLCAIPLLLTGAAFCSLSLPVSAIGVVGTYLCLNLAYSAALKKFVLIDVICLTTLYVLRIIAGHEATAIAYSPWLLAFAMFLFFSLAMVKRYSELQYARQVGRAKLGGRGYHAGDLEIVASLGAGSGLIAVLVMALYINSATVQLLYASPILLLPICPLFLYWISRVWLLAHRGRMHDDPVLFALRDPASYIVGLLCGAVMVVASLL